MFNVVELIADDTKAAPCAHGHIVIGHACYCHDDEWEEGPRKCPVWRQFGDKDLSKWHKREWELIELPMHRPELPGGVRMEMRPCMPDDDVGGCPHFKASVAASSKETE